MKWSYPRKEEVLPPHIRVVANGKGAFGLPSTTIAYLSFFYITKYYYQIYQSTSQKLYGPIFIDIWLYIEFTYVKIINGIYIQNKIITEK